MIKISREKEYIDRIRKYKVILNNNYLGDINSGEIKTFEVIPGNIQFI